MKHSIKREQSHAHMSFAECENQRSLAEGESNVRATLKHMKLSFHLILILATMLTMAQEAWAVKVTKTETFYLDGGYSGKTQLQDNWTLLNENGLTLYYSNTNQSDYIFQSYSSQKTRFLGNIDKNGAELIFNNLEGTVTKVELYNFLFYAEGIQMYVGKNKNNNATLMHLHGNNSDYDYPSDNNQTYNNKTATFESNGLDVSSSSKLKIMFSGSAVTGKLEFKGTITVTYEADVPADPQHTFTFNASGNTLTATCVNNGAGHECTLTNRQATLTLTADDVPYTGSYHNASYNLGEFMTTTGLSVTSGGIKYVNKDTGVERNTGPYEIGSYTARVTVTISSTDYTLTKDFSILAGFKVNNSYPQFSVSKTSALGGDEITITYTQQMDESLDGLTLTGATSGNNIAYTQSGNTYTFTMPAEDVNINATITYPLNENNITQSDDTYTIKTAEGWNYFCRRMEVDGELDGFSGKTVELAANISVTTMAGTVHPFKGTFDGKGKTLTFNHTADAMYTAPFQNTNGATICNLHVEGTITGGNNSYLGGLVGSAEGNLTIRDCHVSTQISTTFDSNTLSANVGIGGFVGLLSSQYNQCHITGCVFDGLIYNPNYSGTTYGCGGFVGCFSEYGYAILEDCLFIEGQYDNNGSKRELLWGNENNKNSTFLHRTNNQGQGKLTNCFFVATHFLKQGSPAVESATAPTNFAHLGTPTDHCFMKTYGRLMLFNEKYYTPTYGDLVETYDYSGVKSYNIEYDDKPLGIPDITTQLWVPLLRYKRTFTNGKPVTVMLPFNFTKSDFKKGGSSDGLTGHFYEFKGIEDSAPVIDSDFEVTSMTANTPYLYVPDDEPEYWYIDNGGDGLNIFTEGHDGGTKEAAFGDWTLKGTYDWKIWDADATEEYVLDDDGNVALATAGTMVKPTSAYLFKPVVTTYYLVGTMTDWAIDSDYQLQPNTEAEGEYYILNVPLAKGTGIKAVSSEDNSTINTWFPGGTGNDYIITSNGIYDIYFRPDGNSDWGYYYLYVAKQDVSGADVYFAKEGYATYYNGVFDVTLPDDVTARIVTDSGERLTYQTIAEGNGTVPAGTAVMLYSQTVKTTGTAASRTLTFCDENSAAPVTATNLLHGSDVATRTTGDGKHYKLSYNLQGTDIGWYWGAADGAPFQSGAHKVWLVLSDTSAPSFLGLDGETTKIGTTDYTNLKNSDAWFTLDGLKLDKAPTVKGVYIHNGRKQVIK